MSHGLSDKHLRLIKDVLARQSIPASNVALFGSRATGTYQPHSDIDLVIYGDDIAESVVDRLWTIFRESFLPYKVDIVAYRHLRSPALKRHIDAVALPLFPAPQYRHLAG